MAKSHTFFGLRSGSTKSHTYCIGRNMEETNNTYLGGGGGGNVQITKDRTSRQGKEGTTENSYRLNAAVYSLAKIWNGFKTQIQALQKQCMTTAAMKEKNAYNAFVALNTLGQPVDWVSWPLQQQAWIGAGNIRLCRGEANVMNVTNNSNKGIYTWPFSLLARNLMPEGGKLTELSQKLIDQGYYEEGDTFALYLISIQRDSLGIKTIFNTHCDTVYFVVDTKHEPTFMEHRTDGRVFSFTDQIISASTKTGSFECNKLSNFDIIHQDNTDWPIVMAASVVSHRAHVPEVTLVPNTAILPTVTLQDSYDDYMGYRNNQADRYLNGGEATSDDGWTIVGM